MSLGNDDGKGIENQVRNFLSGLMGENGDFLNQSTPTPQTKSNGLINLGQLLSVTLVFKCDKCSEIHFLGLLPDQFLEQFFGDKPFVFFDNFQAGLEAARFREKEWAKLEELMARCDTATRAVEEGRKLLTATQAQLSDASIRNSHLQVEVDVLRKELARVQSEPTQTALDLPARRWNFWTAFRGFRLIGREGK